MNSLKSYLQNVQELTKSRSQSWASIEIADLSTLLQIVKIQNQVLETYALTNEIFPEYGDIARQAIQQVNKLVSGGKNE